MEMTGRVLVVIGVWGRAGLSGEGEEEEGRKEGEQYHKMGHRQHSKYYYYILHTPYYILVSTVFCGFQ